MTDAERLLLQLYAILLGVAVWLWIATKLSVRWVRLSLRGGA